VRDEDDKSWSLYAQTNDASSGPCGVRRESPAINNPRLSAVVEIAFCCPFASNSFLPHLLSYTHIHIQDVPKT
jgi:hypothetical protein